jgi:hypothetical protein
VSWLRIFAYYSLAALLTFHLLGVERERSAVDKPVAAKTTPFLEAVPERIDRVRMEQDGLAIQFERKDDKWVVTEPEGISPPGDVIDAVLESFTSLPAIETVSEGVEHEGQFGFVPPRARIRIEQQGTLVSTIILGELSPTRTAVYAKRSGKDEVALIGLNAKYYIDLVFENVRRQRASQGAAVPEGSANGSAIPPRADSGATAPRAEGGATAPRAEGGAAAPRAEGGAAAPRAEDTNGGEPPLPPAAAK